MWRPRPRTVLILAIVASVVLASALTVYALGFRGPTGRPRVVSAVTHLFPAALSVFILQAIPYPSVGRRLFASLLVFIGCIVVSVLVIFIVGCGFYDGCNTR